MDKKKRINYIEYVRISIIIGIVVLCFITLLASFNYSLKIESYYFMVTSSCYEAVNGNGDIRICGKIMEIKNTYCDDFITNLIDPIRNQKQLICRSGTFNDNFQWEV